MSTYKYKYEKYKYKYLKLLSEQRNSNNVDDYNTKRFNFKKDVFDYNDKDKCIKSGDYGIEHVTNKKFKSFDQLHFHAGDYEDLKNYLLDPVKEHFKEYKFKKISFNNSKFKDLNLNISKLYDNIDYETIKNSVNYHFKKFKKGVFICIKDNQLKIFLPFSNAKFKNDYFKYMYFDDEDKRQLEELDNLRKKGNLNRKENEKLQKLLSSTKKKISEINSKYSKSFIHDRSRWISNNCMFRNHYPEYEGDKITSEFKWLILEVLKIKTIPDIAFFLNLRDFPLLKNDLTEPYYDLYDSNNKKMDDKYIFESYLPILSRSAHENFSDIPIPTEDDIYQISQKLFPPGCTTSYIKSNLDKLELSWSNKIDKAIFMGKATGCGTTIETNMRLKAAHLSKKHPEHLKVGITKWNSRIKKKMNEPLKIIKPQDFDFKLSKPITRNEISKYKYCLVIDGHVSPFRLTFEMSYKSTLLIVESEYYIWISKLLKPYVHFVPIKSDLTDLIEKINWCKNNDDKCKEIASNAFKFYEEYCSKESMIDYMENVFIKISDKFKNYK